MKSHDSIDWATPSQPRCVLHDELSERSISDQLTTGFQGGKRGKAYTELKAPGSCAGRRGPPLLMLEQ